MGKPKDYFELQVFGCPPYPYVSDGKLESNVKKCISLVYAHGVNHWLQCIDLRIPNVLVNRDVIFDETVIY